VAVLVTPSPPFPAEPFWPPIHGEARVSLPGLTEFLLLLWRASSLRASPLRA